MAKALAQMTQRSEVRDQRSQMTFFNKADAKIAEDWVLVGSLMLFQQLGFIPETQAIFAGALH